MSFKQPYSGPSICDIGNIDAVSDKERVDKIKRIYDKHKFNILDGDEKRISYDWGGLESDRFGIWIFYKPSCVFLLSSWYFVEYNESKESITLEDTLGGVCKFDNIENWGYVKCDKHTGW